jgi:hypothetical protein
VTANGVAFDAGVIYDQLAGVQGLSFGVVLKNIGPQMKFDGPGLNVEATPPVSVDPRSSTKSMPHRLNCHR